MKPFAKHNGLAAPIIVDNVDTDQIIPSREMTRVSKKGLGSGLFAGWRYLYDGKEKIGHNRDFVLNQPAFTKASIILGGRNFGCGSSREHAVWALRDFGIRVIIAESFGRIFRNNCARNGVLAIDLPARQIETIRQHSSGDHVRAISVDLANENIQLRDGPVIEFSIDRSDRLMLLNGLDYIDYTLQFESRLNVFLENDRSQRDWAHL